MNPVSDNLIHFLGRSVKDSPDSQLKIFINILKNGLKLSPITIPMSIDGVVHGNVVCFTDIPLYLLDEHVEVYGKFGIGFKKSFVKRSGGNPVRYFVDSTPYERFDPKLIEVRGLLYHNLSKLFTFYRTIGEKLHDNSNFAIYDSKGDEFISSETLKEMYDEFVAISSFEKETGDLGPARDDDNSTDSYYREREWRIVPFLGSIINGCIENKEGGDYYVQFSRSDINMVIVPNSDIKRNIYNLFKEWTSSPDDKLKSFAVDPPSIIIYDEVKNW
jgi:hypothetical protein